MKTSMRTPRAVANRWREILLPVIALGISSASLHCRSSTPPGPSRADASPPPAPAPSSQPVAPRALRADEVTPLITAVDLGTGIDVQPEEERLHGRTLRLTLAGVACSFDGATVGDARVAARCQPLGARRGPLIDADDEARISVMSPDGVHDVATSERVFSVVSSVPTAFVDAYRREDGSVLALQVDRRDERTKRAAQLLLSDASGVIATTAVARSASEIEDGRVVGDWLLLSERLSREQHRLIAHRIIDGGRSLGPRLAFGELRPALRSRVVVRGAACRSSGGLFVLISAQSQELQGGQEHALAMLRGDHWSLSPIETPGSLGCHGALATLTEQTGEQVTQQRCAADGCQKVSGRLPLGARGRAPLDVGAMDDKVLVVWGNDPVFMALSPLAALATATAIPIYQPADGEEVKALNIFVRQDVAFILLRTSRGALALRVESTGEFSPIRPPNP
jgi:hypothetical protein